MKGDPGQTRRQYCQRNRIRDMAHNQVRVLIPYQRQKVTGNKAVRHKTAKHYRPARAKTALSKKRETYPRPHTNK